MTLEMQEDADECADFEENKHGNIRTIFSHAHNIGLKAKKEGEKSNDETIISSAIAV